MAGSVQSQNQKSESKIENVPGPVAQGNESATLRRSRSHVQIVPGPPIQDTETGRHGDGEKLNLVIAARSPRLPISSSPRPLFAGVAQSGGGASLRN